MRIRPLPALLLLGALAACRGEAARVVTLPIAELTVPTQVGVAETLHLAVKAESGGCVSYDHLEVEHSSTRVSIRAIGIDHSSPSTLCTSDIRYTTVPVDVPPPFIDAVTVVAGQPDGSALTKVVPVR